MCTWRLHVSVCVTQTGERGKIIIYNICYLCFHKGSVTMNCRYGTVPGPGLYFLDIFGQIPLIIPEKGIQTTMSNHNSQH